MLTELSEWSTRYICNVIWKNPSHSANYQIWVNWYQMNVYYPLFQNFFFGPSVIMVSKVNDVQRLSKIKKNIRIPFICSSTLCDMWRVFSDHITFYSRITLTRFRILRDDKYNVMNVAMVPTVAMGPSNLSKMCFSISSGFVFHSAMPK